MDVETALSEFDDDHNGGHVHSPEDVIPPIKVPWLLQYFLLTTKPISTMPRGKSSSDAHKVRFVVHALLFITRTNHLLRLKMAGTGGGGKTRVNTPLVVGAGVRLVWCHRCDDLLIVHSLRQTGLDLAETVLQIRTCPGQQDEPSILFLERHEGFVLARTRLDGKLTNFSICPGCLVSVKASLSSRFQWLQIGNALT